MIQTIEKSSLPKTLEEFIRWESTDGLKYEWNDGELIIFEGIKKKEYFIYNQLLQKFIKGNFYHHGILISEPDVWMSIIQMRRPDIAYFTKQQLEDGKNDIDVIPEFVIEIISKNDGVNDLERKLMEYFKYGVRVVWLIYPELNTVKIHHSYKIHQTCTDDDICSASPILENFEISVNELLK